MPDDDTTTVEQPEPVEATPDDQTAPPPFVDPAVLGPAADEDTQDPDAVARAAAMPPDAAYPPAGPDQATEPAAGGAQ